MSEIDRRSLRTILASSGLTIAALAFVLLLVVTGEGSAQSCTNFVVTGSTNANWTDTTSLWNPSGSYPGRDTSCDTASDTTGTATTITVDSAIPFSIIGLNLSCAAPGCVIDIKTNGSLTLAGTGTIGSGSKLRVSGGTLTIASGSTLTFQSGSQFEFTNGSVDIQSGGTIDFPSGSSGVTTGGVMGGGGTLSISGGNLNIGSVTSPATFSLTAGVLDGPGFLSIGKYFFWDGGTIKGIGGAELQGGGQGTLSGAIGSMLLDTRTFNNYGFIGYPATTNLLHLNNGAAFNTYGTFDFQDDGDIIADGPSSVGIFPNGLMQKHTGTGVSVIQPAATNDATVFVTSGTIEFAGGGTHNGSFIPEVGNTTVGTIAFSASLSTIDGAVYGGGNISFPSGSTDYDGFYYSIGGKSSITGATLTVDSSMFTTGFQFDSGEIDLIDDFHIAGTGTWSGGTIAQNDGTFFVDSGATLTIDSANGVTRLDTAVMENDGTILYTAGASSVLSKQPPVLALTLSSGNLELSNSSAIFNDGTFDIQTDTQIASTTVSVGGVRASNVGPALSVTAAGHSHGRVSTHRARTLGKHPIALCGCPNEIQNESSGTLKKSADTGTTDFGPQFGNDGVVKTLAGTLHFLDGYTQTSGSTTLGPGSISVASPKNFDVQGGILDGAGTLIANVSNYGEIKPGTASTTGIINITGNYASGVSTSTATISIKLAGPSAGQFDQVNISGTAVLDGIFKATFLGAYTPATGTTTWPVVTYASESGGFTTVNLPSYSTGTVTAATTPTSFKLTAVTPPLADLKLAMSGPASVSAGAPLSYTINVSNLGSSSTSGTITVADTLPSGVTSASGSGTGWTCGAPSGSVITCTAPGPLASGNALPVLTIAMTAPIATGNITNSATVSNSVADPDSSNNTASVTTNVGPQANLSITKTGPASVNAGQNIVYTIVVTNNGPTAATGTTVSDLTPVGIAFLSNSNGCTTAFPCSLGTLNAGQTVTITSTYNVPNSYSGSSVTNTASVSSAVNDPNLADNSSTVTTTVVAGAGNTDVAITKTGPASFTKGQNISYTITVSNTTAVAAASTFVNDSTPPGLIFISNSGACSGPFPCALGTVSNGSPMVITTTYNVPLNYVGTSVTNTATVSTSSPESNTSNNTSTVITPLATGVTADLAIVKTGPNEVTAGSLVDFTVIVTNNGPGTATSVVVSDPTPPGLNFASNSGGCVTSYPCSIGSMASNQSITITSRYSVGAQSGTIANTASVTSSATDPILVNNSSTAFVVLTQGCPQPPALLAPSAGATVGSPVSFSWNGSPNASSYVVSITGAATMTLTTSLTTISQVLGNGSYSWSVKAVGSSNCPPATSGLSSFSVCNPPDVPIVSVVALSTTGQTYSVAWIGTEGASYELQESTEASFSNPTTIALTTTSQSFTKHVQLPTPFFYRVRSQATCSQVPTVFSATAPVIVIPLPALGSLNPNIPVPSGSTQPVTFPIHVPGVPGTTTTFVAAVDKPWLAVAPTSGIMPPEGLNFTISADPSSLQDGTWTGTVIIIFGSAGVSGRVHTEDAAPKTSIPVSISLTTPVTPGTLSAPASTALVVPSVGHLAGLGAQWQSDVRIANITNLVKKVQLTFSGGSATSLAIKQATISIDPGATTALDDIVRNWYGVGAMGDSSNGLLTVQPLDAAGKPDTSIAKTAAVVSSRTYNASAVGTLGQFIPAVPLANFISRAPGASTILSLQQIAQTDTFRTNLGLVEATGKSATLLVSVFNGAGTRLLDLPLTLAAGEQLQLNSFLSDKGISLTNGHIEVQSTGGEGKVTAYASVIDGRTTDPLLVSGVPLGGIGASRFVIPGVANLDTADRWRSDVRIFNGSPTPQTATLTLFPTGNPSASASSSVTIQPGEVKALDDVVHTTFNLTNAGGALHVTTAVSVPLVVTARTYDETATGTLGQFVQAVTPADAVGSSDRALQLLQMEDSPRYRTNLGIAEVTGKAVTAEVTVILPDSKVAPKVQIPLAAFEYRQFPILSSLGLGNTYNARISVKVIDGQGKITAYGSVIDQKTQDPTFVPAQ